MSRAESREPKASSVPSTLDPRPFSATKRSGGGSTAFTLVEVMVVVTLLVLIIFALMKVFSTTQGAFRAGVTQADVLEGGRAAIDLIANDLKPMSSSSIGQPVNFNSNINLNFYAVGENSFLQSLPASGASRTNVIECIFFLTHANQGWKGIGYFVRTNAFHNSGDLGFGSVGSLYRYETNVTAVQYARNPGGLFAGFTNAAYSGAPPPNATSHILEGVMSFKMRAFDPNGYWRTNSSGNIQATNNYYWGEVGTYRFYSNALPASIEIELAVLEDRALQRVESMQTVFLQTNYLAAQAGKVHVFRQRISIPNADPSAYQ